MEKTAGEFSLEGGVGFESGGSGGWLMPRELFARQVGPSDERDSVWGVGIMWYVLGMRERFLFYLGGYRYTSEKITKIRHTRTR